ncbi:MAG: phosphoribosylglycinamide formyltransferase [Capsulimonadaceae bacterium]|nr:phosphoribosylglycinamide formyltransferase [Capsulimonadaceae bacterium]
MFRIAILLSGAHGRGSTLINLADACQDGRIPDAGIAAVIGTVSSSPAIQRAAAYGLPVRVIPPKGDDYGVRLRDALVSAEPDLVCLAGYMRRTPQEVLDAFPSRIVNIHPALLPSFGGQGMYGEHVHKAVYEAGVKVTGCTVHFIDSGYDTGPILLQKTVEINDGDMPDAIAARVLVAEHAAYPEAVRLIAEGRVKLHGRRVAVLRG